MRWYLWPRQTVVLDFIDKHIAVIRTEYQLSASSFDDPEISGNFTTTATGQQSEFSLLRSMKP
jgi:hypothetical protein